MPLQPAPSSQSLSASHGLPVTHPACVQNCRPCATQIELSSTVEQPSASSSQDSIVQSIPSSWHVTSGGLRQPTPSRHVSPPVQNRPSSHCVSSAWCVQPPWPSSQPSTVHATRSLQSSGANAGWQ